MQYNTIKIIGGRLRHGLSEQVTLGPSRLQYFNLDRIGLGHANEKAWELVANVFIIFFEFIVRQSVAISNRQTVEFTF